MDYSGNAKKNKMEQKPKPEKKVERVVQSEVLVQKKGIGRKFKDVLFPAVRNMIVDASTKGIERMMYGESSIRRGRSGYGPRVTYNNPINRPGYAEISSRSAPPVAMGPRSLRASAGNEFILSSREEAILVLEQMNEIIDTYEVVSVADLNALVGFPTSHVDNKWGWTFLGDTQVRQVREGYLLDLPPTEAI